MNKEASFRFTITLSRATAAKVKPRDFFGQLRTLRTAPDRPLPRKEEQATISPCLIT